MYAEGYVHGPPPVQAVLLSPDFDISPLLRQAVDLEPSQAYENFNFLGIELELDTQPDADLLTTSQGKRENPEEDGPAKKRLNRGHAKRQRKRDKAVIEEGHCPDPKRARRAVNEGGTFTIKVPIELDKLPASSCGYRASTKDATVDDRVYSLEHYENPECRTFKWDGKRVFSVNMLAPFAHR
jgi:hypothetical protein